MEFNIKALKENGYKVLKNGQKERIVREDGKTFMIWVGKPGNAHTAIRDINELKITNDEFRESSGISYILNGHYGGTIFDVNKIGIWGTTKGVSLE